MQLARQIPMFGMFLAVTFFSFTADSIAQSCGKCKDQGSIICPKHAKGSEEQEKGAIFCSIVGRCAACYGTLKVECPDCKSRGKGVWQPAAENKPRTDKQTAFEKEMGGYPRATIETPHFLLTFEIESMMVGKVTLDQHQLLHLYAQRMEKLYEMFNELMSVNPKDHRCAKYKVMIWKLPKDQKEASTRYAGQTSEAGCKLLGSGGVFTLFRDRSKLPQDDDLHRSMVHNVAHLLSADLFAGVWVGQKKAGWLDEGLSHWFEDKIFGECTNFCYQEQNTNISFRGGKWRKPVREMAESGKKPSFAQTGNRAEDELTPEEHALSFSYVDFLLAKDPKALPTMFRVIQVKEKVTRDGLKEAYQLGMMDFETQWKEWVLKAYSEK